MDDAGDIAVEPAFSLAFKLRLRHFYADDRGEAFSDIVAGEILLNIFEQSGLLAVRVDRSSQRRAESLEVRAAIHGVDVVGKTEQRFRVSIVVLQRYFDTDRSARTGLIAFHVNRVFVEHGFSAVEMLDEFRYAAVINELGRFFRLHSFVGQRDLEAFVEKRQLAQPL